ncbi:hypothetical protein KTF23_12040 [Burkholderia multivorans]|uniref:hypothetical protein n=1 Tax=Burkholderia multivorans TaxID=87883 RepID=UPI001C24BAC0|nr:hypothetical protein [Burkholderia multivorans]MBU9690572.1 hypothetical protein [Burkholderia multivorans]
MSTFVTGRNGDTPQRVFEVEREEELEVAPGGGYMFLVKSEGEILFHVEAGRHETAQDVVNALNGARFIAK